MTDRLAQLRALVERAARGWEVSEDRDGFGVWVFAGDGTHRVASCQDQRNAALIVALRNHASELLDVVEAAQRARAERTHFHERGSLCSVSCPWAALDAALAKLGAAEKAREEEGE